ncbi:MAG: flagellar export chaperone FliS [Pseudomonadales bacterium]|jgi:flagellar secretion chaperone FliS|nr:flagellar export chaperone FliS [Pseudomonadales bacterium]MDP4875968.1 flagellar export chaperone FliS [Pseudomonadales bacterium]
MAGYKIVDQVGRVDYANQVELVQMLFNALLDSMSDADGHLQRGAHELKCASIARAMKIVQGLRITLDHERGGELARNLDALYDYVSRRLMQASLRNDVDSLREVRGLMADISSAWEMLPGAMLKQKMNGN